MRFAQAKWNYVNDRTQRTQRNENANDGCSSYGGCGWCLRVLVTALQPLIGFSKHKVVGVNVAARLEPDISGGRKPNASEIVGLAVGAVHHEVWGDVCGVQIGGYSADASRHVVNGVQIGGFGTIAGEANGVQIAAVGTEAKSCNGVQLSLLGNVSWESMVAGNCTTNTSRCVQVGLVNICGDHWFPLVNFNFRDCENGDIKKWFALKFCPW